MHAVLLEMVRGIVGCLLLRLDDFVGEYEREEPEQSSLQVGSQQTKSLLASLLSLPGSIVGVFVRPVVGLVWSSKPSPKKVVSRPPQVTRSKPPSTPGLLSRRPAYSTSKSPSEELGQVGDICRSLPRVNSKSHQPSQPEIKAESGKSEKEEQAAKWKGEGCTKGSNGVIDCQAVRSRWTSTKMRRMTRIGRSCTWRRRGQYTTISSSRTGVRMKQWTADNR